MPVIILLLTLLSIMSSHAADALYSGNGFTIKPPQISPDKASLVLSMHVPSAKGNVCTIIVLKQFHSGSIVDYQKLTLQQIGNFKIIKNEIVDDVLIIEASGNYNGKAQHWYSRAILKSGVVYNAVATVFEGDWNEQPDVFRNTVDSLSLQ